MAGKSTGNGRDRHCPAICVTSISGRAARSRHIAHLGRTDVRRDRRGAGHLPEYCRIPIPLWRDEAEDAVQYCVERIVTMNPEHDEFETLLKQFRLRKPRPLAVVPSVRNHRPRL